MKSIKKYLAEALGTFVLVLFACGTAAVLGCETSGSCVSAGCQAANSCGASTNGCGYLLTALAFGLVIVAMAYSIGNISGCHINPAVSLAMWINGKLSTKDFIGYVVSQFIGAIAGAAMLMAIIGTNSGLGANALYDAQSVSPVLASIIIEVILTFVFVFVILGVTSKTENAAVSGLVIGLTLTLVHIFGIHFTGTSVNPARSFGPALFVGGDALKNVWVFIVAPLAGGALAAGVWRFLNGKND